MIQKKERMSKNNFSRIRSFRKHIKPVIDIDEVEDDKRRDSSGRKRVDVIQCLLESSSDENDETDINIQNSNNILWLTFAEICHIRYVLAQTSLSTLMFNKGKDFHDRQCFRCQKQINSLSFLPSFLSSPNSFICYICQQRICKKCSLSNFLPPSSKHFFPVRLQTLIKSSAVSSEIETNKKNESNPQTKTICYDCSQIFNERTKSSQCPNQAPVTGLRQSFSPTPLSSNFDMTRSTHHNRPPGHSANCKLGTTTITATSIITRF